MVAYSFVFFISSQQVGFDSENQFRPMKLWNNVSHQKPKRLQGRIRQIHVSPKIKIVVATDNNAAFRSAKETLFEALLHEGLDLSVP